MKRLHYYQILLVLGGLLAGPLYAVNEDNSDQDDQKYPEDSPQQTNKKSFYQHGDLTFFDREKNDIDQNELKEGLINLSYRIKAKGDRKVYFFIGVAGAGKSLSIQALQGNKIKKAQETTLYESSSGSDDDNDQQPQDQLSITERIPDEYKIPTVGNSCKGETDSTYIYYPDPRNPQYKGIAFADTEGFLGSRKTTIAGKCLSAISFFYAIKANKVGGLVLVISTSDLDAGRGEEGMKRIASILQQYFSKNLTKESILIMVTKVATQEDKKRVKRKLKGLIQLFYQRYYANLDNKQQYYAKPDAIEDRRKEIEASITQIADKAAKTVRDGVYNSLSWLTNSQIKLIEKDENIKNEHKKQEKKRSLKLFYEMLLEHDVPKDKINDINNFKLNKRKYCVIFPWEEKSVQKILDKNLKNLKPIKSDDLCTFNNPVSQYIEARIYDFSTQFKEVTQPLLTLRKIIYRIDKVKIDIIDTVKKELKQKISKDDLNNIEALEKDIRTPLDKKIKHYNDRIETIKNDTTLEIVFDESHHDRLPDNEGFLTKLMKGLAGYKLYKEFRYTGKEPIYKISATYGPTAHLSEQLPSWSWNEKSEFDFIKKHFKIITEENDNGAVTWQAEAKNGKSVEKNEWLLYHFTTGQDNAQCNIKFYARRNERTSSKKEIKNAQDKINLLRKEINNCGKAINEAKETRKKWEIQWVTEGKKWESTAHMLQFFADEILKDGAQKLHIKECLRNYNQARQLFVSITINKENNQKNKPQLEDLNVNAPKETLSLDACKQETDDNEVFDID